MIKKWILKQPRFSVFQKHIKISTSKMHQFSIEIASKNTLKQRRHFVHWKYVKQSTSKQRLFFAHQKYVEESTLQQRRFFVHRNSNLRQTYVEICRFFFVNIDVISTSNRRRFDMVCPWNNVEYHYLIFHCVVHFVLIRRRDLSVLILVIIFPNKQNGKNSYQ